MRYLKDLFGIGLDKFDINKNTYKMEVLWADDNSKPMKLFILGPTWAIYKDNCGYFYPRIGKITLIQKNKDGRVLKETEFDFDTRRFYKTDYRKNQTIETLYYFNHKGQPIEEQKMITTYRNGRKVATSFNVL